MKNIIKAIKLAFCKLKKNDGALFDCPEEKGASYDSRKLHEVCINHHLANYLEEFLIRELSNDWLPLFTDIEFNREGIDFKNLDYNGQEKMVRPDIIIHNRRSGEDKKNFLVVECKKKSAPQHDIDTDTEKIKAFLKDEKYNYHFGLQVIYSNDGISGKLYFKNGNEIKSQDI